MAAKSTKQVLGSNTDVAADSESSGYGGIIVAQNVGNGKVVAAHRTYG